MKILMKILLKILLKIDEDHILGDGRKLP